MSKNFKKMLSYYKPYRGIFWADMFFATVSAAVALAIPLVIRYVTYTLVYEDKAQIMYQIKTLRLRCLQWWSRTATASSLSRITVT